MRSQLINLGAKPMRLVEIGAYIHDQTRPTFSLDLAFYEDVRPNDRSLNTEIVW